MCIRDRDDDIPVPSIEAAAKTILLLIDRPELSWETICREQRVKHVMEYLFIRARNHPDEVHRFVDRPVSYTHLDVYKRQDMAPKYRF